VLVAEIQPDFVQTPVERTPHLRQVLGATKVEFFLATKRISMPVIHVPGESSGVHVVRRYDKFHGIPQWVTDAHVSS
jgi:hypothetical protein